MATIKDVARIAEVSVATVSNYLNKTKPVSKKASARIEKAIEQLQYTQNLAARSLKTNVYGSVGVILPNLTDSYYLQIFQGIETAVNNAGLSVNLAFSHDIPELEEQAAHQMLQKQVSGLILVTCCPDKGTYYRENFTKRNRHLILIDRRIHDLQTDMIRFNGEEAVYTVTDQLLNMGYRNLSLMAGPENFSCEQACKNGFLRALKNRDAGSETVMHLDLNKESAFRKTTKLLKKDLPECIIATSELTATGIIEALHVLGRSKEEIPVITLGEEHWNRHTHTFSSFSVERPAIQIGAKAAEAIIQKVRAEQPQESVEICLNCTSEDLRADLQEHLQPKKRVCVERKTKPLRILMLDIPATHTICRMLKNFEDQTGIHAEVKLVPHSVLYQSIKEHHDSGAYDVYMYDLPWLPLLAKDGILKELSREMHGISRGAFLPGSLEDFGKYGQGYYGIPLMYAPQVLYYRKSLFHDTVLKEKYEKLNGATFCPPRTFTEYYNLASFFTEETDAIPYGISVSAAYPECLAPELYMRLKAYGSEVIDRDGNVVINNQNARKAYTNLLQCVQKAKPNYKKSNDVSVVEDFLRGETAMLISYPGFLTEVTDLRKNNLIGSIGCTHIPGRRPLLGGWSLGISSVTDTPEDAFAFLQWACTDQMSNYFSMLGTYSAVTSTYANDELIQLYPWRPLYREVYPYATQMIPSICNDGTVVSTNQVDEVVCKWLYKMFPGKRKIETILEGTQRDLEALLKVK